MPGKKNSVRFFLIFLLCFPALAIFSGKTVFAEEDYLSSRIVGEAFGKSVTSEEFIYYYKTAAMFTRMGTEEGGERSDEEVIQEAWQNLIFRKEARDLNVTVSRDELKAELERLLFQKGVEYGTDNYRMWVMAQFKEDANVFDRRIEDLLVINKFLRIKTEPEVTVTEEEMKQKFLNQYNSFESEYIRFESGQEVKEFAEKVKKNPGLWKDMYDAKKPDGQKGASWINIMSLEALIDLWQIPKDDAYRILKHKEGDFIAVKFYYGDAVFRLLRKKEADVSKYDDKKQEYYRNMLTTYKKQKIVKDYFEDLLKRANYKDYVAEERRARKIEDLKKKASVILETNRGKVGLRIFPDIAPLACENFIGLVEKGYYNGIIFHRVIKDFMIQGGDPTGTGTGGQSIWEKPFVDETNETVSFDKPGILAMANSGPNTNQSQFFITTKPAPWLNSKHTIFGEVVSGYDVVEKMQEAPTDSSDKPKEEQKIINAYVETQNGNKNPKEGTADD